MISSNELLPDKKSEMVLSAFTPIIILAFDNPKSVSKTATLNPMRAKFIAEFTARQVLPTPPLPLTKANDFTIGLQTVLSDNIQQKILDNRNFCEIKAIFQSLQTRKKLNFSSQIKDRRQFRN